VAALRKIFLCAFLTALAAATARADARDVYAAARGGVVTVVSAGNGRAHPVMAVLEQGAGDDFILGSGVIFSSDGLILTANHAVADVRDLAVVFSDMSELHAEMVVSEPLLDIALLRVKKSGLSVLPWRLDEPVEVGESVFAVGTPSAFSVDPSPSITAGIICALHRSINLSSDVAMPAGDLLESDCLISPGESGGALVDSRGRLVGMCLAAHSPEDMSRGRAYAIPADAWLRKMIDAMLADGRAPLGEFAVQVAGLGISRAQRLGLAARSGVEVTWVKDGGPCDIAGMASGDVVTRINGVEIRSPARFRQVEMRLEPGATARVRAIRPGGREALEFEVEVAARSDQVRLVDGQFDWRGMRLSGITARLRESLGIHFTNGVVVRDVDSSSPSHRAGLRAGDVIVEINNIEVRSLSDVRRIASLIPAGNVVRIRTTTGIGHIQGETRKQ
jgi:serine protease Do